MRALDLTGKRFGRLTVLHRVENRKGRTCWLCRCDCGKDCIAYTELLRSGGVQSCGCLNRENHTGASLIGKRFGNLLVIDQVENKNNETWWKCKCDCGNIVEVPRSRLITGFVISCGCKLKEAQTINREKTHFQGTNIGLISSKKMNKNNNTGVKGVCRHKKSGKYMARIRLKNKEVYLGLFPTIEEARIAREKAEELYFQPVIEEYKKQK